MMPYTTRGAQFRLYERRPHARRSQERCRHRDRAASRQLARHEVAQQLAGIEVDARLLERGIELEHWEAGAWRAYQRARDDRWREDFDFYDPYDTYGDYDYDERDDRYELEYDPDDWDSERIDERDPAWPALWVDGKVDAPDWFDRDSYEDLDAYACVEDEIDQHEWLGDDRFAGHQDPPADLAVVREVERIRAGDRYFAAHRITANIPHAQGRRRAA